MSKQVLELEQILRLEKKPKQIKMYKTIDQYAAGTIALFTPPPKPLFVEVIGPWAPSVSYQEEMHQKKMQEENPILPTERLGLSISPRSTKLFGPEIGSPLMRVDRDSHDGLPEDHLQFGSNTYTGRYGNEAYEIITEVFKNTKRDILFPFNDKKKPWEY